MHCCCHCFYGATPCVLRPSSFVLLIVHSVVVGAAAAAVIVIGLLHKLKYLPWHHQIRFATPPIATTHTPPPTTHLTSYNARTSKIARISAAKAQKKAGQTAE